MAETPLAITLIRRIHLSVRQELNDELQRAGYADLTLAHIYVFQSPGPDGRRPTELAASTNMTKQAMNHLLVGLERGGYLTRAAAPGDGRATVVSLTPKGRAVQKLLFDVSMRIEREWARRIGRKDITELRRLLVEVDQYSRDESTQNSLPSGSARTSKPMSSG
ncbi:MAG: MarR family transcriptional regulator [Actinobacteria bacterium]|nr:MAG: MarR family transcriptional regulator [Actinomycetota bacterium]